MMRFSPLAHIRTKYGFLGHNEEVKEFWDLPWIAGVRHAPEERRRHGESSWRGLQEQLKPCLLGLSRIDDRVPGRSWLRFFLTGFPGALRLALLEGGRSVRKLFLPRASGGGCWRLQCWQTRSRGVTW